MAERLGLSQSAYSKIESGFSKIPFPKIQQIAKILEVDVKEIMEDNIFGVFFQPNFNDNSTNNGNFNYHQNIQENLLNFLQNYLQTEQSLKQMLIEEMKESRVERKLFLEIIKNKFL